MKKAAVELPFDDGEVTPLHADDPRPQRVPQFPSNNTAARKAPRKAEEAIPTSVYEVKQQDEEFQPSYENGELSDPGFKPAFLYVERGPGAGQLVPVRQGIIIIGRASVSELRLQHPSISRRHAQVTRKGDFFYVKDLGSQNGTYVNRQKIDTEVEVQPGDELAVGNALLKLRGPVQAADSQAVSVPAPRRKKQTSGAVKVALFAGAVGFGLAAVMMFALLRTQHPSYQDLPQKKAGAKAEAPLIASKKADSTPVVIADDEVSVKIQKMEKEAQAKKAAQESDEPTVVAASAREEKQEPVSAVAVTKGQKKTVEPKKVAMVSSKARSAAKEEAADEEDEAPTKSSPSGARGAIMARYEAGNVGAAIDLARKANDSELLGKLQKFESSYEAAKNAVESNNTNSAVKNYEAALKIDKTLSSGWGKYGTEIQHELGRIYALGGNAFLKAGDQSNAKKAFGKALSYDPSNSVAKNGMAQLGGDEEKPASKRAAIADAFGDEEDAPAPKKKVASAKAKAEKPAAKRSAIDDAFGD